MHVVITGAAGFIGHALAARLSSDARLGEREITRLSLVDLAFEVAPAQDGVVHLVPGDLANTTWLSGALGNASFDVIFHLASLPGGAAEADYALARRVNLDATVGLLEGCKAQVDSGARDRSSSSPARPRCSTRCRNQ